MNPIHLTHRENEVMTLANEGLSSKEIADKLYVSKRTVDFHKANIFDKLSSANVTQALNAWRKLQSA